MTDITGACPICDGSVSMATGVEVSEIVTCPDCSNNLVVESLKDGKVVLAQAPEVEEDWGE